MTLIHPIVKSCEQRVGSSAKLVLSVSMDTDIPARERACMSSPPKEASCYEEEPRSSVRDPRRGGSGALCVILQRVGKDNICLFSNALSL